MSSTLPPAAAPPRRRSFAWSWAALSTLVFTALALHWYYPPLACPLSLEVEFAPGMPGQNVPLITSGVTGDGELLYARYVDRTTIVLLYDLWGSGGPTSVPFKVEPGSRHQLVIEMPILAETRSNFAPNPQVLRVSFDGHDALRAEPQLRVRRTSRIFVGENPISGSVAPTFTGKIFRPDGREIRGNPARIFTMGDRFFGWLHYGWPQVGGVLIGAAVVGFLVPLAWRSLIRRAGAQLLQHRWFIGSAALGAVAFVWVLTGATFKLAYPDSFGNFYDAQARSLLQGRLDVPESVLSGEAFVVGGKYLGYFGVTPALLRLPWAIFDVNFGEWTRVYLLCFYLFALVAAYLVLCEARRQFVQRAGPPPPWIVLVFTLHVGLGSTLFFVAGRAFVYHEAAICGAAFAIATLFCVLKYLANPTSRWWAAAWLCGLLSLHARPSVGLFALALPGFAALLLLLRSWRRPPAWRHLGVGALCIVGVLSFNALSYLKFGTFDGAPLKYHVQYSSTPKRLAALKGSNFHLTNSPYTFGVYAWRRNLSFRPRFPYLYLEGTDPHLYPNAVIDVAEPTLSLPWAMPGLCLLATVGVAWTATRVSATRPALLVLVGASAILTAVMLAAVAVSQRYTIDFCPGIIGAAAIALATLELAPPWWRRSLLGLAMPLTLCSILITFAITLHFQSDLAWGVPDDVKHHFQVLRQTADHLFGLSSP